MTIFQGRAFSQGLVLRHAPKPVEPRVPFSKFSVQAFRVRADGRDVGTHRVMSLARGSRLRLHSLLDRAAAEAGRFLGVRPRQIETVRAKTQKGRRRAAPPGLGVF
jgi:hypothetical protein